MLNTLPRLSVWEISCRINDLDPYGSFNQLIPPTVRDSAKSLTRAFHFDDIPALSSKGIENHTIQNEKMGKVYSPEMVQEKISECYEDGIIDMVFLDSIYIENESFVKWCQLKNIPLPKFWFPYGYLEQIEVGKDVQKIETLRSNQIDKLVCQAIGSTLWDIYPNMTIADMCDHKAIQIYGNGKQYKGAHTLRDWLSTVAPPEVKNRRGRPKRL